jgi:hypothetical protein
MYVKGDTGTSQCVDVLMRQGKGERRNETMDKVEKCSVATVHQQPLLTNCCS